MKAMIYVRDKDEALEEIMPYSSDGHWNTIREFYCPGCMSQLEVEAVPPDYPIIFDFLPDIEGLYNERPALKKKIPV